MTPTDPGPAPAGWYDDPQEPGRLRYFDGIVWTSHVQPRLAPAPPPVAPAPPAAPTAPTPPPGGAGGWTPAPPYQAPMPAQGPQGRAGADADTLVLATPVSRLLARILDAFLKAPLVLLAIFPWWGEIRRIADRIAALGVEGTTPDATTLANLVQPLVVPLTLVSLAVGLVYEVGFLVAASATPGKMAVGIRVRPLAAPGRVPFGTAVRRQALSVLGSLLGLTSLGSLGSVLEILDPGWLLVDPRRQALHDKVASTVVVTRRGPGGARS